MGKFTPSWSNIISSTFGSDSELYGRKPVVPESPDFGAIAGEQIEANLRNLPSLRELAALSTDALSDMLERAIPGYKTLRDTGTKQISSLLRGELPKDVQDAIARRASERGIETGTAGSQFASFGELRTLGLTSLDAITKGLSSAESWIAGAQNRTFDFSKMFIFDPFREGEFRWQRDWLENQVTAAPDPAKRGALETDMAATGMLMGVYGGSGAAGGRSYNPSYGGVGGGARGNESGGGGYSFFGSDYYGSGSGRPMEGGYDFNQDYDALLEGQA